MMSFDRSAQDEIEELLATDEELYRKELFTALEAALDLSSPSAVSPDDSSISWRFDPR
jgi:hypothetical protein